MWELFIRHEAVIILVCGSLSRSERYRTAGRLKNIFRALDGSASLRLVEVEFP